MTRDDEGQSERSQVQPSIGRRGVFAAAWAVVAAFILRKPSTSVEAVSGTGTDGTLVMGSNGSNSANTTTATTLMLSASNFLHGEFFVFDATGFQGTGVQNIVGV